MEHISTQALPEGVDEDHSVGSLLERREELDQTCEAIDKELQRLHTGDIETIAERLFLQHENDDGQSELEILLKYGGEVLPDEYYEVIRRYSALEVQFRTVERALDNLAGAELSAYVRGEAQALLDDIDSRRLTNGAYTTEHKYSVRHIISKLQMILESDDMSYDWAEACYDDLERSRALLDDLNMLGGAADMPDIVRQDAYTLGELYHARMLNRRYRTYHDELDPDAAFDKPILPAYEWQIKPTDEQRHALEYHLRSLDVDQEIARLSIQGLDRLPFYCDESELRLFLRQFPAIAFEGVDVISFKFQSEVPQDEKSPDIGEGWVHKAQHSHELSTNRAEITIWLDPRQKTFEKEMAFIEEEVRPIGNGMHVEMIRTDIIDDLKKDMLADVAHEIGHAFHYTLPVSLLHEWDRVANSSTADKPVSHYVKHMFDIKHRQRYMEDFADTFKLYFMDPEGLQRDASDRYATMKMILDSSLS